MGSKFLSSDDSLDLTELQTGTFNLNVSSAVIQSLATSLPVRTNADRTLTSGLIQVSDCAFAPLTNPASENLDLASYAITDIKEMLLESNAAPSTPPADMLTIYTSADKLMYKDDTTATYQVATSTDLTSYLPKSGGTMTGTINMGTNNITGTGAISASTFAASSTTDSTSVTTGALTVAGGIGISKKAFIGTNAAIGPASSIAIENTLTLRGIAGGANGPNISCFVTSSQYPTFQLFNFDRGNIGLLFDCYFDTDWKSSNIASNYKLYKTNNKFNFEYSSGAVAGSLPVWNTAGFFDTTGALQWNKPIKTADTTDSSSSTTGSIVTAGGLGVAKKLNVGSAANIAGICSAQRFESTSPRLFVINTDSSISVSYTSLVVKFININSFSYLYPNIDYARDPTTGTITYYGFTPQIVKIEYIFSLLGGTVGDGFSFFISQNGSTTKPPGYRQATINVTGAAELFNVSAVRTLTAPDTIQLASTYSATTTLVIVGCQCIITPIN